MPSKNNNINTVVIIVHLGTRSFDVKADESETATPSGCRFTGGGMGGGDNAFLQSLLAKIGGAYGTNTSVTFCVDGNSILPDQRCP
jgi:hypothetical protein